jgi:hypothetical protein
MKRAALLRQGNPHGLEGLNCNESTAQFTAGNSTKRSAMEYGFLHSKLNKDQFFISSVARAPACPCLPGAQRLPQQALSPGSKEHTKRTPFFSKGARLDPTEDNVMKRRRT